MPTLIKILADLNERQKEEVDSWEQPHHDFSDHVFGPETSRVTIPLEHVEEDVEPHPAVKSHLENNGFAVHNYKMGIATDKHGRQVKIGKALAKSKAPEEVRKAFDNDPSRAASTNKADDLRVTFSRHPHDVAAMSTGQGWTSCMDMKGGIEQGRLRNDIEQGTHVAYLHHKDDKNLKNPIARIALKPFKSTDKKHTILVPENKTYGEGGDAFANTVNKWTAEHFKPKPSKDYEKHHSLYDDSNRRKIFGTKTKVLDNPEDHNAIIELARLGTDKHRDKILELPNISGKVKAEIARRGNDSHRQKLLDSINSAEDDQYPGMWGSPSSLTHTMLAYAQKPHSLIDKILKKGINHFDEDGDINRAIIREGNQKHINEVFPHLDLGDPANDEAVESLIRKSNNPEHLLNISKSGTIHGKRELIGRQIHQRDLPHEAVEELKIGPQSISLRNLCES